MRAVREPSDGKRVFLFRALIGLGFVRWGMGIERGCELSSRLSTHRPNAFASAFLGLPQTIQFRLHG